MTATVAAVPPEVDAAFCRLMTELERLGPSASQLAAAVARGDSVTVQRIAQELQAAAGDVGVSIAVVANWPPGQHFASEAASLMGQAAVPIARLATNPADFAAALTIGGLLDDATRVVQLGANLVAAFPELAC